jgi:hypothetical protein
MEAEMFENPHIIHIKAGQRQKELLAELEMLRKMESSSDIVLVDNGRFGKMLLVIADLLIAAGVFLKRKCASVPEKVEDVVSDDAAP